MMTQIGSMKNKEYEELLLKKKKLKEYNKRYYKENRNIIKNQTKLWAKNNVTKVLEYKRNWVERNNNKIKEYYLKNKEKIKEKSRLNYFKNPKKAILRARNRPKEQIAQNIKRYIQKYPDRQKARAKANWFIPIPNGTICQYNACENLAIARHHPDYSKPLKVMLLCKTCHYKIHIKPFNVFKKEAETILEEK